MDNEPIISDYETEYTHKVNLNDVINKQIKIIITDS